MLVTTTLNYPIRAQSVGAQYARIGVPNFCAVLKSSRPKGHSRPTTFASQQYHKVSRAVNVGASNPLKRKRVLVTGGAGFLGSHVVDLLVEAECSEIIVIDNMTAGRSENLVQSMQSGAVKLVVGDIRDDVLMRDLVGGIDTLFHLAALEHALCIVDPKLALEVMAEATFKLFDLCARSGVRKIVMASCASVYGKPNAYPTTERHDHYSNRTLFGAVKSFGESLLRAFNEMYGINYVALRYFDVYGPRMCFQGRQMPHLTGWIERIDNGFPPILVGDGSQTLDMLHVEDAARANILAAVSRATDVALNIGSGNETSYLALVRMLARIMGRPNLDPVFWEERPFNSALRRFADTQAARRAIDFEARIPLSNGLKQLVEWWRNQLVPRRLH